MFEITFKNYRCFSDESPATIEIESGFTSLVGINNSGKSTVLRFFHEFRYIFAHLASPSNLHGRGAINVNPKHVEDWLEIFHNHNERDLRIEITDRDAGEGQLKMWCLVMRREQTNHVSFEGYAMHRGNLTNLGQRIRENIFFDQPHHLQLPAEEGAFVEVFQLLGNSLYVGPFRNAISEGQGNYYDIAIGTTFITQWDSWKTGASRAANQSAQQVADDIAHIFDFDRLDINASNDKKALQVIINKKPYRLRELGAGLAQFIIVFGNVATRKPTLLLIDEPELNLHPSLQMDFLTSLASYSTHGVMFATHSVGLARAVSDRIFTFQKFGNLTSVRPFGQMANYAEFIGEMSFSSFKELGYDRVLLVEGVTEVKAIQQFLRLLRKDHTTVLLPLGGSQFIRGGVQDELYELSRMSKNIAVLIDSERSKEGEPLLKEREAFVNDCKKLKFKVHVTKKRSFENYLTEKAVQAEKGDTFRALEPFQRLKDLSEKGWSKSDNWRIARRMTRDELLATDVGKFLEAL